MKQNPEWHYPYCYYPHQFLCWVATLCAGRRRVIVPDFADRENTAVGQLVIGAAYSFDLYFLNFVVLGPILIMLTMSAFAGLHMHDMWGTPLWNFVGLWAVTHLCPPLSKRSLQHFAVAWIIVFSFGTSASLVLLAFAVDVLAQVCHATAFAS